MTGHQPRKRFGQNFLTDQQVIAHIVDAIAPESGDRLVEIGPGLGALTLPLMRKVCPLHVVEIDRDLISRLRQKYPPETLVIHEGDALSFDFGQLASAGQRLRIVGNLPYNISTPLLFHLADAAGHAYDMHFMLQKEVVERLVAEPGCAAYGRLSVMLQYRFAMDWLFDVPPESFYPVPKVESAVIRLIPLPAEQRLAKDEALLGTVVSAAFGQRRKMLRNTLGGLLSAEDFDALALEPTLRAEAVPVADYVGITNYLSAHRA